MEQLLARSEELSDERIRGEREAAAREKALRAREEAAVRERHLIVLAAREEEGWLRAAALVSEKKAASYDQAVRLLADLREVAVRQGRGAEAGARLDALCQRHATKRSFIERLKATLATA